MHMLDEGRTLIVESIIRSFKNLDTSTSKEPLLLALVDYNLKRQADETPSVESLFDRSKIITPGLAGEPSSCLPKIFQHTFLPEHQHLACVFTKTNYWLLLPCYPLG